MNIDASRSDLRVLRHRDEQMANLEPGFVRFSVDSFGLTSNNITYAVFGDMMQYWNFFPVPEPDTAAWGRVPVWGFATVTESTIPELTEGDRYFGYFPMASMFDALPGRFDSTGFTDLAPHRQNLPSVYNRYSTIASDPSYSLDDEASDWPTRRNFPLQGALHPIRFPFHKVRFLPVSQSIRQRAQSQGFR